MKELEKVIDRIIYGTDMDWNMNIHHFDWVPGVGLYGIWRTYEVTGKAEYLNFLLDWAERHLEEAYVQKTVNSTAPILTMMELYRKTGDKRYGKVCFDIAEFVFDRGTDHGGWRIGAYCYREGGCLRRSDVGGYPFYGLYLSRSFW